MIMKKLLFLVSLLYATSSIAQYIQLTENAQVSIITVEPGKNLYDAFGHSAYRVKDHVLGIDQAYNYGMYNFNKPNFYLNFAKGKLEYELGSYPFTYFLRNYVEENRSVTEQILNISQLQKQQFFEFLENNAKPENKTYLYDFLYDNCATKLPEVSHNILQDKMLLNYEYAEGKDYTFRDLIHQYLDNHPWGSFGIDLALGSVIDKKATPKEYTFLPDYVLKAYEKATIKVDDEQAPLVFKTNQLFISKPKQNESSFLTPFILFSLLALLVTWITFNDLKKKRRSKWLDFSLFFFTGTLGLLITLLWFATDHTATAKNYNVFWAFAPNMIVAFLLLKNTIKPWLKNYFLLLILLLVLVIVLWIFKIQVFAVGVLPILLLLGVRYWYLYKIS